MKTHCAGPPLRPELDSLARLKTDSALLGTPHHPAGELPEGRPAADSLGSPRVPAVGPGSPEDAAGPDSLAPRREVRHSLLGVSVRGFAGRVRPSIRSGHAAVGDAAEMPISRSRPPSRRRPQKGRCGRSARKEETGGDRRSDARMKATAKLLAQKEREEQRLAARQTQGRVETRAPVRPARPAKARRIAVDSTALREIDSLIARNDREMDSLLLQTAPIRWPPTRWRCGFAGSTSADSLDRLPRDSIYRLMKGFRNVRILPFRFPGRMRLDDGHQHRFDDPPLHQSRAVEPGQPDHFRRDGHLYRATARSRAPSSSGSPMMVSAARYDALQPGGGQDR